MSKEVAEEYASSLADLTVNSKPLINMLTILAEENIDHAGVIVETVEKHLEKVHPDIKLPVLYLVDSIIKNVGGAYTQKFSQSIVNMFTRTFKQVDEKVRSQMFKLRETWHDVFPATKLYHLDVKVNLIDPAWPIQAQPQQSNIHVNPNFLKKTTTSASSSNNVAPPPTEEDEKMRSILAKKEQELLMLQRKKVEMELEQMRRQVEMAEKTVKKVPTITVTNNLAPVNNVAPVPAAVAPVQAVAPAVVPDVPVNIPAKQRLGPPVNKPASRIAPVSGALVAARRDPRLARHQAAANSAAPAPPVAIVAPAAPVLAAPISPNVFDIKPLEHVTKRKNVITIDVKLDAARGAREPRRRDPRLDKRDPRRVRPRDERRRDEQRRVELEAKPEPERQPTPAYVDKLPDPKKISKLPPIPKINRAEKRLTDDAAPPKRKREGRAERRKRREEEPAPRVPERPVVKEPAAVPATSPEKKSRKEMKERVPAPEPEPKAEAAEVVPFKELRNYHKERYMRRNREKSESPEPAEPVEPPNVPDVVTENKDVDLRVLHPVVSEAKASPVAQKRPSTEAADVKSKKAKIDKFDVLFGNEDVDLRQLPQVDEVSAPPPPSITSSPKSDSKIDDDVLMSSPKGSPKRDWNEVKKRVDKKTPSKLDLVRAKLAEATKAKDGLGRPLLFSKSPSVERERRRTLSSEDVDRVEDQEDFDENKKSISIIMSQAKEHLNDGQLDKNQYNTLMYQVLQLNERLKLKEAKQRESLEISKRKLNNAIHEENNKVASPKSSPNDRNKFGDIDERVTPSVFLDTPPDSQGLQDSDMRLSNDVADGPKPGLLPLPPNVPMYGGPFPPMWRGQPRPRGDDFGPRRFRGPMPPYFRGKFDKRAPRPPFIDAPRMPILPLPTPKMGMCQGECPLARYERVSSPPPLGASPRDFPIPPTDFKVLEYIDQDPFKTIQIDGFPREIRFYGDTAVIMLEWDDPREIKFLPGCRRVTFDNKDSIVLNFNEGYKQVEIDDQKFDIKFGAPTRELYINGRWYECFFGGQPLGVIIDGKPRLVHLEGPMPQVDIGKVKRTDLVAGKINLIVNATQIYPVYLDAKVQKILVDGQYITIRFVDSLRTVLINEKPFKVSFGDLPKPIEVGSDKKKYFIRFSALPRNIKPGHIEIANMEGVGVPLVPPVQKVEVNDVNAMETDEEPIPRPVKTPSPEIDQESLGLDMLASVMPSSTVPASSSEYSLAEPLFSKTDKIPGLETPSEEKPPNPILPILSNINVNDLFAKLVATGIVQVPNETKTESKEEAKVEEVKKPREDRNVIHRVDFMKPETLRVKQPGLVSRLYGGMQCSGCGARFPPEHTVRYSQHLDWHFRQNRRDRDSARRAHSRHWHYDLSDWVQYEEVEDLEEREKSWFETGGAVPAAGAGPAAAEGEAEASAAEAPSAAAGAPAAHTCALCGDTFLQFYNEDKEEWHLRNALKHGDDYYHPLCFDDYKSSLTKEEPPKEELSDEVTPVEKIEDDAIEIKDVETIEEQSDNESVVEVVEDKESSEPVEIDEEGEEDDVVFKAEPVEEVVVDDDNDTDDETAATRAERDRQAEIDFSKIKIKQEPIDPDDEPIITAEEETIQTSVDTTHATVESSIDGNLQLDAANAPATVLPIGGIRINISKSLPSFVTQNNDQDKMLEDISADDEPLPPGEEPELEYKLKPSLEGVQFSRQPPVCKGNELSGLCSIM
ncbi:pcf11 cleavage and polyadenylation factor subunit isoform X2 [Anticarsia gemmatalis]|uniref:pcf11 cleavage and polyadenylation factor subunit isoform X2 n=1 Tax=Anticarsia gemmatalis TaxID=129554 RepID=UPI003F766BAD